MPRRFNVSDHAPLIGEPLPDLPKSTVTKIPAEIIANLDNMSASEMISTLLKHGVDAREVMGETDCTFHTKGPEAKLWKTLPENRVMNSKLQMGIDVVWCRGCFSYWRLV